MANSEKYMMRCIELARQGGGLVSPNPMVGAVIVYNGKIIGEGYHHEFGGPHAEVVAIKSVKQPELLKKSTIYVTLEPCSHHGKTPPCSQLIVNHEIPHVVIGTIDPFALVSGRGIEVLKNAGVKTEIGILENECRQLNRRFFTFHEKKRPYIILKWAQTADGFVDIIRDNEQYGQPTWITNELARRVVHMTRAQEDAIMVATRTAEKDDPSLTVREWSGKQPVRITIDRTGRLPGKLKLFDNSATTWIFTENQSSVAGNTEYIQIDFKKEILQQITALLFQRDILSLIVEGGPFILAELIRNNLWDEAHIYTGNRYFFKGVKAPEITGTAVASENLDDCWLNILINPNQPL